MHIGFIPDGARRYAQRSNLPLREAYTLSLAHLTRLIEATISLGVSQYSVYALSKRNLQRASGEIAAVSDASVEWLDTFYGHPSIGIRAIGELELLPKTYRETLERLNGQSRNSSVIVNVLAAYDPWNDLSSPPSPSLEIETSLNIPDVGELVDLVVRSGGGPAMLSGFRPMQCSYAEIHMFEGAFCEIPVADILDIVTSYVQRPHKKGL